MKEKKQSNPGAVAQVCASPVTFTSTEVAQGKRGIRWVDAEFGVSGHPTLHHLFDYIVQRGPAIDCNCERCADWKARFAAGAGAKAPMRAAHLIQQAVDEVRKVTQELDALKAEKAAGETDNATRLLLRAIEALELVMEEPVGDGIQVKQRIDETMALGVELTLRDLKAATVGSEPPVRDIRLPDGTVRHNVGSDNLSDEDRASMALTGEQVDALNEDERRNGPYGGAPDVAAAEPSGTPQPSGDDPVASTTIGNPDAVVDPKPVEGAAQAESGEPETPRSSGVGSAMMSAYFDNIRNAGHKVVFGMSAAKKKG